MKSKNQKILEQIALRNGVSVSEVRKEIEIALEIGRNNPDPMVQARWREIPCKGEVPTFEEVLDYMAKEARRGKIFM